MPETVMPPETSIVRPRNPCRPASVTMKAGMPSRSIASPFTTPINAPSSSTSTIAGEYVHAARQQHREHHPGQAGD